MSEEKKDYSCKCALCHKEFIGNKRSLYCDECEKISPIPYQPNPGSEPAYPIVREFSTALGETESDLQAPGMTIRQKTCIAVMQGMLSSSGDRCGAFHLAVQAVEYADALLKREKETRI